MSFNTSMPQQGANPMQLTGLTACATRTAPGCAMCGVASTARPQPEKTPATSICPGNRNARGTPCAVALPLCFR
jgi:hypothetical protein